MTVCIEKAWENKNYHMSQDRGMAKRIGLFTDIFLTSLVFFGVYAIKQSDLFGSYAGLIETPNYLLLLLIIIVIWYVTMGFVNVKYRQSAKTASVMVMEIFNGVTISTIILVLVMYILKITDVSRLLIFLFYVFDMIVLIFARLIIQKLVFSGRSDYFDRNILILGSRATAKELIQLVYKQTDSNIKIVGCIDIKREDIGKTVACGVQVIGTIEDIRDIMLNRVIDEILITMPLNEIDNSEWYLSFINTFGITIRIIPYWYIRKFMTKHASQRFEIENFLSEPALTISKGQEKKDALLIKSIIDFFMAVLALIVTFPIILIVPFFIKWFSPGPVFYRQIRCGLYGRKFQLFKFRTMVPNAEEMQESLSAFNEASGPAFKIKKDPRIIPYIGTFLRKISLDELPQFINVIRGEMSVVGPRPPLPSEVEKYELWQRRRLSMKPGITCLWQIQPRRNDISFDQWMDMDMNYIDYWSLWMDIVIILKTIPAIISGRGR
jgi:exopolysaccharide biosynthesis polyprenyl glycosylphosphotransferase